MSFISFWITYAVCGAAVLLAVLIWAIRTGQFTQFDRQARLALEAEPAETRKNERAASRWEIASVLGVPVFALAVIAAVLLVAARSR